MDGTLANDAVSKILPQLALFGEVLNRFTHFNVLALFLKNDRQLPKQLSPIHPQRVVHKLMLNLCLCDKTMRIFFLNALLGLLHNERPFVLELLKGLDSNGTSRPCLSAFPPSSLIGKSS
jgi:hypothetical protein